MNVLFLTLVDIRRTDQRDLYSDLMRQFAAEGHHVYIVSPAERRHGLNTQMLEDNSSELSSRMHILKVKTGNVQKTNIVEKGISTILLEYQLCAGIRKYLRDVKFDLVMYSTPPITLKKPIAYIKKRDGARSYLLLKDIFPQNAVDIGMMTKSGVKGVLYHYFRRKEKKLYAISDCIGCMSQANVDYVLKHNPEVNPVKVEICPNAIEVQDMSVTADVRTELRDKYGIPQDKKVFVYGGNLGRPQGISFVMECLKKQKDNPNVFFLLVGDGTEYKKLEAFIQTEQPANAVLLNKLPKEDYDRLVAACDVGLIFLDHRFTIPNFPSRLLGYLQAKLPVLACTDPNTDIGKVITEGGFGWCCESNDTDAFGKQLEAACAADLTDMGAKGFAFLHKNYCVERTYQTIMRCLEMRK